MLSEEEVRKSFARVKEDILQVKRSLNKQVLSVEEINKAIGNALGKEEFYAFIKRLGSKIEELENSFPEKSDREDVDGLASELRDEIAALRKLLQQRDGLADEVREVRSLKGKVLELEGSFVSRAEFSKEATKLKADFASVKVSAAATGKERDSLSESLSSSLSKLSTNLADLSAKFNSLTAKAVVKEDIASFTDRIESSHQEALRGFAALKRDVDRKTTFTTTVEEKLSSFSEKLSEFGNVLAGMQDIVSKRLVDRHTYEKAVDGLSSGITELQKLLESSMSEVNLDDYATKRSVKQQLSSLSDSLSSSVSAAVASDFSSKLSGVEEQLQSLKPRLDSVQKNVEKQLKRESDKFAAAKDVDKMREELESVSSGFIPSEEFYSKVDKLEGASARAYDEFRKEIKRQRELFEEHLKSLESYYRSSNDTLKAEVEQLRSSIKALSKAGEQAKVEMAKVSASAAKVAAKTAADLIEEAEEDAKGGKEGRRGKGPSPLAVSVVIVALLLIGSVSYVLLKGGEKAPVQLQENVTQPIIPPITGVPALQPEQMVEPEPVVGQPEEQPLPPETSAPSPANVSSNLSVAELPPANVSNLSEVPDRSNECQEKLGCTQRADGGYLFDCYFDNSTTECRCFVGGIEKCPQLLVENESAAGEPAEGEKEEKGKAPGARYYAIVIFIVLVVAFFAYRALFVKEDEEKKGDTQVADAAGPSRKSGNSPIAQSQVLPSRTAHSAIGGIAAAADLRRKSTGDAAKAEKSREKPKAKEEKGHEKLSADEGDDVIDLEEFFEKKETRKK